MTPGWVEVNAAVLAVLGEFTRPRRPVDRHAPEGRDVFADRLLSLRHVEALGDVNEVRVASGTVVTPLARDWLRGHKIELRVVSARESALARVRSSGEWGFAIESRSGQAEAIRRTLLEDWAEVGPDASNAARWLVEKEGRGAFLLTDEASVASWRASRFADVRSATVAEPEAVSRAIRALGANLIVVEPAGKSIYLLKQIGERFRRAGAPVPPDWLEREAEAHR